MEIKADVKSISKLKDYFFLVPDYQREYVWKPDDEVEQFLIDINNEYEADSSTQKSYFIGSIIIVENNTKYDVIDGQQRLTTIMLSLCAFRDLLKPLELDASQKKYLQTVEELLSDFDISSEESQLRLELQYEESKDYLSKLIQQEKFTEDKTASIIKMEQAYEKLKSDFSSYLQEDVKSLISYIRYFLTKIELVVIVSENLSSALKIFETINQRGTGLNAMDLVKNLLFSEAKESDFQKIKETWKEITNNLQQCKEDNTPLRFLRYFLMARYHDGIIREDNIYKWIISAEGKRITQYENTPLEFAKEIKKISKRYAELVIATESIWGMSTHPSITNIGSINKYKSRQHLILLLALDSSCQNEEIEYLGQQIESFFFYSNTLGIQAKNNERLFAQWANQLRGKKTIDEIAQIVESTMVPYIKERVGQFRQIFPNLRHDSFNPLYRQRFVLSKFENAILQKSGLPLKGKDFLDYLQIEHILPQTPKDGFIPEEFKDKDDYDASVNKLGNVTLLESTINQAVNNFNDLANDWFNKKQSEYINSNVLLTNLLNHDFYIGQNTALNRFKEKSNYRFELWNKQSISKRQEILMELALDSWRFNGKRIDDKLQSDYD